MTERTGRRNRVIVLAFWGALSLWNAFDSSDPTLAVWNGVLAGAAGVGAIWAALKFRNAKQSAMS